jgi:outer membrane receptor protein involved in Fe transport
MKKVLACCILSIITAYGTAQKVIASNPKGQGVISGMVKDSLTNMPMKFVTLVIKSIDSGNAFYETISDDKGKFTFTRVPEGAFELTLSFTGYNSKIVKSRIKEKNEIVNLGTIILGPRTETLKEVIVDSRRSLVEEKVDRTVYNAERDKTIGGGDATDVMRRVPLLSVDLDGNVTIRGSQNIKVLINNKPSTIGANNLADALKQIPADQIKSVEVITSPSAKYDADGSAGIINIILKKNNLLGITLNMDGAIGLRASFFGLNGEYRNKKMGFSIGGFGRAAYNVTGDFRNIQAIGTTVNYQNAGTRRYDLSGNYNLGWDYEINKKNYLTATVRYSLLNSHNFQDNLLTKTFHNAVLDSTFLDQVGVTGISGTVDISFDYTHAFSKLPREFTFLTLFSRTDRANDFINFNETPTDFSLISKLKNTNTGSNQEITQEFDYQTAIDSNQLLEIGGKYITRNVTSDFKYLNAVGDGYYIQNTNPVLTNVFNYRQNIEAGYLDYTLSTKSAYSFKVGGRYEFTTIRAQLYNRPSYSTSIPSYGLFVPNINISRRLKNGKAIKFAYNRRIQRPSIQFLNPNIQPSNPLNVTTGNPALSPEYTNNFELSYSTYIQSTTLNFATFYRRTTKAIESVRLPGTNGDTVNTTFANIGKESTYGLNLFANLVIGKKLSLNAGADLYYLVLDNNLSLSNPDNLNYSFHNQGWVFSARLSGGYNISKGWSLYVYGFYRARQIQLQGYQSGFPYYSLTLRKEFLKKKGTIGIGSEYFFTPSIHVKNVVQSKTIAQQSTNVTQNLSFRVNFSFRIGKLTVEKTERKKRNISNDDLKGSKD